MCNFLNSDVIDAHIILLLYFYMGATELRSAWWGWERGSQSNSGVFTNPGHEAKQFYDSNSSLPRVSFYRYRICRAEFVRCDYGDRGKLECLDLDGWLWGRNGVKRIWKFPWLKAGRQREKGVKKNLFPGHINTFSLFQEFLFVPATTPCFSNQ